MPCGNFNKTAQANSRPTGINLTVYNFFLSSQASVPSLPSLLSAANLASYFTEEIGAKVNLCKLSSSQPTLLPATVSLLTAGPPVAIKQFSMILCMAYLSLCALDFVPFLLLKDLTSAVFLSLHRIILINIHRCYFYSPS